MIKHPHVQRDGRAEAEVLWEAPRRAGDVDSEQLWIFYIIKGEHGNWWRFMIIVNILY